MLPIFYPRVVSPAIEDENWMHRSKGGRNDCLYISGASVLPNCVGYAYGRWLEILHDYHNLSRGNAENWYFHDDQYERGIVPKLGAVICWRKGLAGVSGDGAGHVAIVEDILADGSIVTSNSAYLGSRFYMRTIKPPFHIGGTYVFQGFIYLPIEYTVNKSTLKKPSISLAREVINGEWGDGADRKARVTAAGYNSEIIQDSVNLLLTHKIVIPPKSIETIAQEILNGDWGNGFVRKNALRKAGYNYEKVQAKVVQLLALRNPKKLPDTIAREVISGKWGVGLERKLALIKAGYDYTDIQRRVNNLLK